MKRIPKIQSIKKKKKRKIWLRGREKDKKSVWVTNDE